MLPAWVRCGQGEPGWGSGELGMQGVEVKRGGVFNEKTGVSFGGSEVDAGFGCVAWSGVLLPAGSTRSCTTDEVVVVDVDDFFHLIGV